MFKNYALEVLLQKLTEEKEKEQQRYFSNLANNAYGQKQEQAAVDHHDTSPIETVFSLNLRESLLSYQEYFESLLKEKEALVKKVKMQFSMQIIESKDDQAEKDRLNQKVEEHVRELDRKFNGAIDQLVLSYDEHMKKVVPKPKLLPIRVSVQIESKKNMRIENIHVKPYDNINDLFKVVEEFQVKKGDPILTWNK